MNLDPNHTTIEEFPLSEEGEACEEEKEEDEDEDKDTQDNNNKDEEVNQGSAEGPEPTMAKQKRGPRKKKGMLVVICMHTSCSLSFTGKAASPVINPKTVVIVCSLAIISTAEMKKPKSHRETKARLLETPASIEWVDFQAWLYYLIRDTLYPRAGATEILQFDFSLFEATYTIPRHVLNALPLLASADYAYLLKNAMKVKDPSVKIVIIEKSRQLWAQKVIFVIPTIV
jgi:hypothetical protein